jgi:hypothetical protein
MSRNITSREYAEKLRALASELDGLPEFPLPHYWEINHRTIGYFSEKGPFLAAVKSLGTGAKSVEEDAGSIPIFVFHPKGASFRITIYRDGVCKLVRPAEYDCAPLLAPNEW